MKLLLLVACFAVLFAQRASHPRALFDQFKRDHGKNYSAEEESIRFANFKMNLAKIDYLRLTNPEAQFEINSMSDLSQTEFSQFRTGRKSSDLSRFPTGPTLNGDLPERFNWIDQGVLGPCRDQGQCGSCWAFGATATMEAAWAIANNDVLDESEQMIVDCVSTDISDGCNGGMEYDGFEYVIANGDTSETAYPYTSGTTGRAHRTCELAGKPITLTISSWTKIRPKAEEIQQYVYQYGPVNVGVNAESLSPYSGGIFSPKYCPAWKIDHAVVVVGWDVIDGTDVWIVRNSWGTDWGVDGGYFNIERGVNKCGIETEPMIPFV